MKQQNRIKDSVFYFISKHFLISDKLYLKYLYKKRINKKLNIKNPKTFNEKIQWLKLYDRNPKYLQMVDKYEVKKYLRRIVPDEYLIPTVGVWDNFDDIQFSSLPNKFVIKCTHDSGSTIICNSKKDFDFEEAKTKINYHLSHNFYYSTREWVYKNIKPRIIIEPLLENNKGNSLIDYKFICSDGKVKIYFTCSERNQNGNVCVDFYNLNGEKMPFERHYKNAEKEIRKPDNFKKMIEISKKLSKDIPLLRVDFYEIRGKLYIGELTFYPGSGFEEFTSEKYDKILGDMIDLSKAYCFKE